MDKTLLKIIGATTVLLTSVAIISLILLQVFEREESEDLPLSNPKFATPTIAPQVKVIKTPTPIPTPIPTPTPEVPSFGGLFMAELSNELNISPSSINLESYKEYTFSDASLDCPKPGELYAQVLTPGWIIIFNADNRKYEIHSNLDGSYFVNCSTINWKGTENLVESLNLKDSKGIVVKRLQSGVFEDLKILDENEIGELIDTINIPLKESDEQGCEFLYKLEFNLINENIVIYTICSDGSPNGIVESKTGKTYIFPKEFLDIIGKFSSLLPFPGKPSLD